MTQVATPIRSTCKMTVRQFRQLGEDPPGARLELVDGEIAVSPSPQHPHAYAVPQMLSILVEHVRASRLGIVLYDLDTALDDYNSRRPDILFFSTARQHLVTDTNPEGVPDLAVEVISPSGVRIDRRDKFAQYAAAGIAFYWLVDPAAKTFEAYARRDGAYREVARGGGDENVTAEPFADLSIDLARLWWPPKT